MTFVYIVRCRFTEPAKEQAWNDWYSGPKLVQMLSKPLFRTCQRFRRTAGLGRDYLALWTVESPEALRTKEYTAQWGFSEWERYITDWSRDLFDGGSAPAAAFAVPLSGSLQVVSFDGMSEADALAERAAQASTAPDMLWLPIAGLDRHTPLIGLKARPDLAAAALPPHARARQAIYRPLIECQHAPA